VVVIYSEAVSNFLKDIACKLRVSGAGLVSLAVAGPIFFLFDL